MYSPYRQRKSSSVGNCTVRGHGSVAQLSVLSRNPGTGGMRQKPRTSTRASATASASGDCAVSCGIQPRSTITVLPSSCTRARKDGVKGKSVSARVDIGGRRIIKKKKNQQKA